MERRWACWRRFCSGSNPAEELRRLFPDPVERARDDEIRRPLGHRDFDRAALLGHLVVVDVEPRRQAERTKYIDLPIPELYDPAADPKETRNLASTTRERLQVLTNLLRTYNVDPPNRPGRETAAAAAALRSLGYVQGSAPAKAAYTAADDPKRLVEIDRDLHAATTLMQDGRKEEAIAMLNSVIARRPDTADAYISLAHAYWEGGRPERAIASLEHALASGAPDRDVRIRLGIYLAESHADSAKAIKLLEGMSTEDVEALNGLGIAYGDAGRYGDAIDTFRKVRRLDPTNALAYQNLASMVLRQALAAKSAPDRRARLQESEAFARKAIDVDATLPDAFTTLGVVLSTSGRKAEAIDSWKRAAQIDPAQFNALYNLWFELATAGRPRRSVHLRPPVRRHCPARLLPARHRPHQALPRRGLMRWSALLSGE